MELFQYTQLLNWCNCLEIKTMRFFFNVQNSFYLVILLMAFIIVG